MSNQPGMRMRTSHIHITGYSLIEMIVVIVVLAIGLTGITLMINRTVQQSPEALVQTRAMELAHSYLDEILSKRFDENSGQGGIPRCNSIDNGQQACSTIGPDSGENRQTYDDVDDYHGTSDNPPILVTGTPSYYDSYTVTVTISLAGTELGLASNNRAKRITVNVITPLGNTIPVSAYRVNY